MNKFNKKQKQNILKQGKFSKLYCVKFNSIQNMPSLSKFKINELALKYNRMLSSNRVKTNVFNSYVNSFNSLEEYKKLLKETWHYLNKSKSIKNILNFKNDLIVKSH